MRKHAQAVIFDFGNVLGTFNKLAACEVFAETSPYSAQEILAIIAARLEKRFESGGMSESAFCNQLLHYCKVAKLTMPDVRRIWGNIFRPNPAIDPIVDGLIKQRVPLAILSNTNAIHWEYIRDLPVMRTLAAYGTPFVLSYEIRAFKPDAIMFTTALRRLKTEAAATLYLDDIEENVVAARKVGLQAEWYDCSKDSSHIFRIADEYHLLEHELA